MAVYDFYCTQCDKEFVVVQSIHDDLPMACTTCGSDDIKQKLGLAGSRTATGLKHLERIERLANEDTKRLRRGHDRTLSDLVGDRPNSLK